MSTNFSAGLLTLTGDSAANNIQLSQLTNGDWQVKGIGTKIDGGNAPESFSGVTDITIDLAAGNDVLKVQNGTLTGKLFVDYTAGVQGSKTTQFANLHVGTFDVEQTSTGNNVVTLNNIRLTTTIGGIVTTGSGKDVVSLNNIYAFGITVNTGGGNDAVTVTNSFGQDDITVNSGDGSDVVVVNNCQSEGLIEINLGDTAADGNDTVNFTKLTANSIQIDDPNGSDTVVGSNSTVGEELNVDVADASKGNDTVALSNCHAGDTIDALVGIGVNAVSINKCTAGGEINIDARGTNAVSVANSTTQDQLYIFLAGSSTVSVNNVTAANQTNISGGDGQNVFSIDKLNVLSGQTNITTGDANDVIAITNSKFNSAGTPDTSGPFPVAVSIETNGGKDSVTMVNDTVINGLNMNTGDGTDAVSLVKLNATAIGVGLEGGICDTLAVTNCTSLSADFNGGNNTGDTLVQSHNQFASETYTGFDHVIG